MWRISGIFRSVWVIFKPKMEIADYFTHSQLFNDYRSARFFTDIEVESRELTASNVCVRVKLSYDGEDVAIMESNLFSIAKNSNQKISLQVDLEKIVLW